jgi:hypothetical protein
MASHFGAELFIGHIGIGTPFIGFDANLVLIYLLPIWSSRQGSINNNKQYLHNILI